MGCVTSQEKAHGQALSSLNDNVETKRNLIVVATLNYGGILNSPFEFFSDSEAEEHQISLIFRSLIPVYVKDFDENIFKWDVGKIEQKIKMQRYSPVYRPNVGVENNKLIGEQEFDRRWEECFSQAAAQIKVQPEPTEQQINNTKLFDLICYHTLLKFVYKINDLKEIQSGKYSPKQYIAFCEKYFSRSYLNQTKKITKVKEALKKHSADVFFFQEPTKHLIDALREDERFYVKQKGDDLSMLLIKKSSFKKIDKEDVYLKKMLTETQYKQLDWNLDTCFIVCDNYILISGHLSSKKEKNVKQVEEMKNSLNILKNKCQGYHIIVGADTNSFVTSEGIEAFEIYPNSKKEFTTRKKRTFMQAQFHKAETINEQCKDQVFSTLKIVDKRRVTINNEDVDRDQSSSKKLLPTDQHPFDHFMLLCSLQKP